MARRVPGSRRNRVATAAERPYAEAEIWSPIAQQPDTIGYPGALTLHHVQIGNQSGYVDLLLLPTTGPKQLVLVEAKSAGDRRSSADVIGQLLKYYVHALDLGSSGLEALKRVARENLARGRPSRLLSFKYILKAGGLNAGAHGRLLEPGEIELIVAVDRNAPKFASRLLKTARVLRQKHEIPLGVVVVTDGTPRWAPSQ